MSVLLNVLFRQKIKPAAKPLNETVSVLIPARNEEKNIGLILSDLQKIENNNLEVLVYNDQSTDNTAKVVQEFAKVDGRISCIESEGLPDGWLGKNNACYNLAKKAKGNYYLFIDADVRIEGDLIGDAVAIMKRQKLGLLTIFPYQILKTFGEQISVPVMNYILLTLLPLVFVRISPFKSHSAANGQFMLFDAKIYDEIQPHRQFRNSAVEDIAISRFFKKRKIKLACITGEKRVKCRMYNSYHEALNGFAKNVFMFFGNSPMVALLFWLLSVAGFVPVLLAMPQYWPFYIGGLLFTLMLYSVAGNKNPLFAILLFPFQMVFLVQVMVKGLVVKRRKSHSWKGRLIYS